MANGFLALYSLLKASSFAEVDPSHFARLHRWTASRALWDAEGASAFNAAWRDPSRGALNFVENFFVREYAKAVKPEDVDPFARILLTV